MLPYEHCVVVQVGWQTNGGREFERSLVARLLKEQTLM
jgi:hypothetical protein